MSRPRTILVAPPLTPGEATYVLERLIADRRVTSSEVQRYVASMHDEIGKLEYRLQMLRGVTADWLSPKSTPPPIERNAPAAPAPHRRRSRKTASSEVKASQQLQGQYVSLIRQIPKYKRVMYQKIVKERGRDAAIAEMRVVLHK